MGSSGFRVFGFGGLGIKGPGWWGGGGGGGLGLGQLQAWGFVNVYCH